MKTCRSLWIALGGGLLALVQSITAGEFRVHEWGTFTTLHLPSGSGIGWYQPQSLWTADPKKSVSDLPSFVSGNLLIKAGMMTTARMETPVVYFYTDEEMKVDVGVNYSGGAITEFYPGLGPVFRGWKGVELIPPAKAGDIEALLPIDAERPNSHYYQARAVPDAALVRFTPAAVGDNKYPAPQHERFLFYRGAGRLDTGLVPSLTEGGTLTVNHTNQDFGMNHVWALQSSAESLRWEKLPAFRAFNAEKPEANLPPAALQLDELGTAADRHEAIASLKRSMITALISSGLTAPEASAMVATWDEQWYEEPGQRLFSIVPESLINGVLPLNITPTPEKTVRVFVHRQEVLDPQSLQQVELAMAPQMAPHLTKAAFEREQLGRFIYGVIENVAAAVGHRTHQAYRQHAIESLAQDEPGGSQTAEISSAASRLLAK